MVKENLEQKDLRRKKCLSEYVGTELSLKRDKNKSMHEPQKKHHETRMKRDKELYERQIRIVDAQIDRLVYDLYGLTEEEVVVKVVGRKRVM